MSKYLFPALYLFFLSFLFIFCDKNPVNGNNGVEMTFTVSFSSTTNSIRNFLVTGNGSSNAKLVFVKKLSSSKQLYYIDFSENSDTPVVHKITNASDAQVPVISPDGKWVVYAKSSGQAEAGTIPNTKSSAYICKIEENSTPILVYADSAFEPRFIQTDPLTVIFPTQAPNRAWAGKGRTLKIKLDPSTGNPVGPPEVVLSTAAFTGGMSYDGKYLTGGGGNVGMIDLTSTDTVGDSVTNFQQACNASISSSRIFTNSVMYLTTNASHPKINNGKPWAMWEVLLINNIKKEVLKGIVRPDSASFAFPIETNPASYSGAKWHHCEWSNHPYFAAATLNVDRFYLKEDGNYFHTAYQERIYLVNLKDSTYIEVLRPDTVVKSKTDNDDSGFHWPWLWVEIPASFTEEPAWLKPL